MILRSLPMNDYHAHDAISNSKLKSFRDSGPLYYKLKYIDKTIHEERTEALLYGAAFDTMLIEPDKWDSLYAIKPTGMSFATKEGKAWKIENAFGPTPGVERDIIPQAIHEDFAKMQDSLLAHPVIGPIISSPDSEPQVSLRHKSSVFGLEMQTRPDWLNRAGCELSGGKPFIADLKTTQDLSEWFDWCQPQGDRAIKSVVKYAYHRQAALAQHVAIQDPEVGKVEQFLIVVEKQEPFRCGIFQISDAVLDIGFLSIERDLKRLKRCIDLNEWPNSPEKLITINQTVWLSDQEKREADAFNDETQEQESEFVGEGA